MPIEQLQKKEIKLRDWMGEVIFSPEVTMTDHLAKVLAMQAAAVQVAASCGYETLVRVHAVEVGRTGISFVITSEVNERVSEFLDNGLPGLRDLMMGIDGEISWVGNIVKFNGADGSLRLSYSFPEPEKEGFGKLSREWKNPRPLAGILGRGLSGKLHVVDLAEEGFGQTLLMANDGKTVSGMIELMLTSLRRNSSERGLKYAIPADISLEITDRLKLRQLFGERMTTAKALTELLAIVEKRKAFREQRVGGGQILAVIDLCRVDFSNREQRGNFTRLMSLDPQNVGVHLIMVGTARFEEEVLDKFVRPIIETLYISGGYYNSTRWLAGDIDPFSRPFSTEWIRAADGKETVFLPAKI